MRMRIKIPFGNSEGRRPTGKEIVTLKDVFKLVLREEVCILVYLAVLEVSCFTVVHVAMSHPLAAPVYCVKRPIQFQLNRAILLCDVIPSGKLS
jgi:hypothetical protein